MNRRATAVKNAWRVTMRDGVAAAALAALKRRVDRAREERGALEVAEVAGEHRGHDLALAEDARVAAAAVDHGDGREVAVEQRADRRAERLVGSEQRRLVQDEIADRAGAHAYLTIT
jgi:hypothetical protein